jgi:uncharacterized protein (TIGR00106 family)
MLIIIRGVTRNREVFDPGIPEPWLCFPKRRCPMAILEISVVPIGVKGASLSPYVADCIRVLKKEKVPFEMTAMGTNVEGDLKKLLKIAAKMHEVPFRKGAPRVVTTLKIDDRRDKKGTLAGKKKSVQDKLG